MLPQKEGFGKSRLLLSILVFGLLLAALVGGNGRFLRANNDEQQFLPYIVNDGDAEATPTATATITPTMTTTPTATPIITPTTPYIVVLPDCSNSSTAVFNVIGANWPINEAIALFWNGSLQSIIPTGHSGRFLQTWTKNNLIVGTPDDPTIYVIRAQSSSHLAVVNFHVPCHSLATTTPTPITTATNTPTATPTLVTATPTATGTPPPSCGAFFIAPPLAGTSYAFVTGEIGATVTLINLTTGQTLGTDTFIPDNYQVCPGVANFDGLIEPLVVGHVLLALPSVGQPDTAVVESFTPTPTFPPPTPSIGLAPNCSNSSNTTFDVFGANWPTNEDIYLYWDGTLQSIIPSGHPGNFLQTWTKTDLVMGTPENPAVYSVLAQISNYYYWTTDIFSAPCPVSPTPTSTYAVPLPDLAMAILSTPYVISTHPVVAYQPVDIEVMVQNLGGDTPDGQIFFVDIFFDPTIILTNSIPISQSVGYVAISGMSSGETRVLTIPAPLGFGNSPTPHTIYSVIDSLQMIVETDKTNNISLPGLVPYVTPAATLTPSPTTAVGTDSISGIVRYRVTNWQLAGRAVVTLFNNSGQAIATTTTNLHGFYNFANLPPGTYNLRACTTIDNIVFSGVRIGVTPPDSFANVYMLPGPCS